MAGRIPAALRTHLGDDGTFALVELLESEKKDWSDQVLTTATDRFERRLTHEVGLLRQDFHAALQEGLGSIRSEMANMRAEMAVEMGNVRVEMLRWSFVFWIGQVAAVAALLALMLRK